MKDLERWIGGAVHTTTSERTVALDPRTHISDSHVLAPFAVHSAFFGDTGYLFLEMLISQAWTFSTVFTSAVNHAWGSEMCHL